MRPARVPCCEKKEATGRYRRSGRHQVPVAVLPTAKLLSAFSLKPKSDRLLEPLFMDVFACCVIVDIVDIVYVVYTRSKSAWALRSVKN
jgi:hypothetical protein